MRSAPRVRAARALVVSTASLVVLALPLAAQSQTELPTEGGPESRHPEAADAIGRLWSPYCPGFMLEVCSSSQGAALRDSIQTMAEQGATSDEIVEWMLGNHGQQYLALPRTEGVSLLAWLAPPAGVILGLLVVVLVLRHMMVARRAAAPDGVVVELSEEDETRLRDAMLRVDEEEEAPLF